MKTFFTDTCVDAGLSAQARFYRYQPEWRAYTLVMEIAKSSRAAPLKRDRAVHDVADAFSRRKRACQSAPSSTLFSRRSFMSGMGPTGSTNNIRRCIQRFQRHDDARNWGTYAMRMDPSAPTIKGRPSTP